MGLSRRNFLQRIAQLGGYSATFSAMRALGMMPESGISALPTLPSDYGKGKTVVILGGGIAGLVSAYELTKAGFHCTVLEVRNRPGGRNWSVRNGTKVEFTDGTVQDCTWSNGGYLNAGPGRIPSIHTHLLGYCQQLGVPLEVEVNVSRSAMMQSPALNGGRPVEQRRVIHDSRGYIAELLSKAINNHTLDNDLSAEEAKMMVDFLHEFGDLDKTGHYVGSPRAGFSSMPAAGLKDEVVNTPLKLHELLVANLAKGEFYDETIDWQATMFQPVGGMDRIPYGFAKALPPNVIQYECAVTEITTGDQSVTVAYTKSGAAKTLTADFCICTMPLAVLVNTKNNFSPETQKAFKGMPMTPLYKVAWEAPRFWETGSNIYGGISFTNQTVDLVWYPSANMFSKTGVVVAGYGSEFDDGAGKATPFGALPDTAAKLNASRAAVEALHPGKSSLLSKPIYINWGKIPHSLGCFANNHLPKSAAAYKQLDNNEGRTYFAGDYLSHLVAWQEGAVLSAHLAIERIAAKVKA